MFTVAETLTDATERRGNRRLAGRILALGLLAAWALWLRPVALGGTASYVKVSGTSMLPTLHTGDFVLLQKRTTYAPGDVIVYRVPAGERYAGMRLIHRIVGGDATTGFVVQGDNVAQPDPWRPTTDDILGARALRVPNAGFVIGVATNPLGLGVAAFGASAWRSRGRLRRRGAF